MADEIGLASPPPVARAAAPTAVPKTRRRSASALDPLGRRD
jgi:hypothetical protein